MQVWVEPAALDEIKKLPGNIRQRIRRAVKSIGNEPRPPRSHRLETPENILPADTEARRIRLDNWRIVYVVDEAWDIVTIVAVRKRPPYDYNDLPELLADI